MIKKLSVILLSIFICKFAFAVDPVGEGGSYVPKQSGDETTAHNITKDSSIEGARANKPYIQSVIEDTYKQHGFQTWGGWRQEALDAAVLVNGTWQTQWQIQTIAGTFPYSTVEAWRWEKDKGIFYDNEGWMWKGKTAGSYLQVETKLVTGSRAMLTIQFLNNNEAVGNMNVSGTKDYSPCMGQFRAVRVK